MTIISHDAAAALLFASGQTPSTTRAAAGAIVREYRRDPDLKHAAAVLAEEYGEHWETASARMRACLRIAPDRIELPDSLSPADAVLLGCADPDCTRTDVELVGKALLCPMHAGDALRDALLGETAGYDTAGADL